MALAAFRGHEAEASPLIEASTSEALLRGEGGRLTAATWARAVLNNGLGRYQNALAAAQQASESPLDVIYRNWALAELIEAAVRSVQSAAATDAYRRLAEMAAATATGWALGLPLLHGGHHRRAQAHTACAGRRTAPRHTSAGGPASHQADPPSHTPRPAGRLAAYRHPVARQPCRIVRPGPECAALRAFCPAACSAPSASCPAACPAW